MNFRKVNGEIDWANQPAPGSKDTMTTRHHGPIPDRTAAWFWRNDCFQSHQLIHTTIGFSHEQRKRFPESSSPSHAGITGPGPQPTRQYR